MGTAIEEVKPTKIKRALGVTELFAKKYRTIKLSEEWARCLGEPELIFHAIIYGGSGNGKTDFCMQLAKELCKHGKVYYNSIEQGHKKTIQDAARRQNMQEVAGQIAWGIDNYEELVMRLKKKKSAQFVFIDSRDDMRLTIDQYNALRKMFPKKSFIIVCYEKGAKPRSEHGTSIEFRSDIKIRLRWYVAYIVSRYGGNKPFISWEEGAEEKRQQIKELKQITN